MRALALLVAGLVLALSIPRINAQATRPGAAATTAPADVRRVLDQYCVGCHNSRSTGQAVASGVVLDTADVAAIHERPELWERVVRRLRAGSMPPSGSPRPDAATTAAVMDSIAGTLDRAAAASPNPGHRLPQRLNRAEYANAVRDLLVLDIDAASMLPPDDASADGFDNNAAMLGASPALLERYLAAAARISAIAVGDPALSASSETYRIRGDASQSDRDEDLPFGTRGGLMATHTFPLDGEYVIKVKLLEINLGAIRGLEYQHDLEITVDGERVLLAPVGGPADYLESGLNAANVVNALDARLQVRVQVKAGQRKVGAAFIQKPLSLGGSRLQPFLRTTLIATDHTGLPHVEKMTVSGPFNATGAGDTASRRRVLLCTTGAVAENGPSENGRAASERACATRIISTLARRAYRRPVTDQDLAPLLAFYDAGRREAGVGSGFERGIERALRGVLVSPKFIFRVEPPPLAARASAGQAPRNVFQISDIALASNLSFFLWSSIPDDELVDLAARGRLRRPGVIERQVRRMLADRRAKALVDNFAGQWLHVRNVRSTTPDKNAFPDFDDNLRQSFARELELFVGAIVAEDRSVLDLLAGDFTYLDERLARHYRIPNVYGAHFRRVTLEDEARRGLLGKGGILLVTSHADRTSPVVRGKWILDNLIGTPPAPPPAEVPAFPEASAQALTVRARMAQHRSNPACATCHKVMDPLGLALENFDAVGAWRTHEAGVRVDASGELGDGKTLEGIGGLRQALLDRPEVFVGTMTEKLLTYALGRDLEPSDMPAVRGIVAAARRDGYRFSALVRAVVSSVPFQMRRDAPKT
jgi:mono/diheme cytochrome c family protein